MPKKIANIEGSGSGGDTFGDYLMDDTVALMDDATTKMSDNDTEASQKPLKGRILRG